MENLFKIILLRICKESGTFVALDMLLFIKLSVVVASKFILLPFTRSVYLWTYSAHHDISKCFVTALYMTLKINIG